MKLPKGFALFMGGKPPKKPKQDPAVFRAIERHRGKLLQREQRTVDRMLRLWRRASVHIERKLTAVEKQIESAIAAGGQVSPAWLYQQQRWTEFEREITTRIDQLTDPSIDLARVGQVNAMTMASTHVKELAQAVGVGRAFRSLPISVVENFAGLISDRSPVADLFRAIGPSVLSTAREVLSSGLAAGENPRKIGRRLRAEIADLGPRRAVTIARQESLRVYRFTQQQNYEANADILVGYRIVCARDGRSCWMCIAQDGKILEHGEKLATHVACRCGLAPVLRHGDKPRVRGEEWLKQQPLDFQRKLLGPARHDLWRSGKVSLHDMIEFKNDRRWGPSARPRRLDQLAGVTTSGTKPLPPKTVVQHGQAVPQQLVLPGMATSMPAVPPKLYTGATKTSLEVRLNRKRLVDSVEAARKAIDSVHGPGSLEGRSLPVVQNRSTPDALGYFAWRRDTEASVEIGLRFSNPYPVHTMVHEFGHFLDHEDLTGTLGKVIQRSTPQSLTPAQAKAIAEYWDAIEQTKEIQEMMQLLKFQPGSAAYWLSECEIWARSYVQYVTAKTQDKRLIAELDQIRAVDNYRKFPSQWSDRTFDPIIMKIDAILRAFELIQ